ncbi:hypothetical protein NAPIS_ORF01427 [Vairimorpha apis BRL 01]|uniref:Reverse transcriptase n=1 Tax=Vairimorpha apis BRL 01 TaxID=1037528 RepID=T0MCU4_9MICR|nr:hypothetical protein NAPIS_ORF01427 [Vairimorpha apis BRL 01]
MRGINEHAISLLNYYIGLIDVEPDEFAKMDHKIRQILIHHGIHLQPSCKERLYLNRQELGRGLACVEHKAEMMILNLKMKFEATKMIWKRREAILAVQHKAGTYFATIEKYLKTKYSLEAVNADHLLGVQKQILNNEISNKTLHKKLFKSVQHDGVSIKESSKWLSKGNNQAIHEAKLCFLQDRNIFFNEGGMCPHCNKARKTVDHMATRCEKMLGHDYMRRHNAIVKCIHLLLCNKHNIAIRNKKLRGHSVQQIVANKYVEIRVDTTIKTDVKIRYNKPGILLIDKIKKELLIVEIGVTSLDNLQQVESEKFMKYDELANELGLIHGCKTKIIPYVITWDGIVSKYHSKHKKNLVSLTELRHTFSLQLSKRLLRAFQWSTGEERG